MDPPAITDGAAGVRVMLGVREMESGELKAEKIRIEYSFAKNCRCVSNPSTCPARLLLLL